MEKMYRSYHGRVACLTDVVRSTIICSSMHQVRQTAEVVLNDTQVHVVKNRLSTRYNGGDTYGYRDLSLQLSFPELGETEYAGLVFELQIHLAEVFALKSHD